LQRIRQLRVSDNLFALLIAVDVDAHAIGGREPRHDLRDKFETLISLDAVISQPHLCVAWIDQCQMQTKFLLDFGLDTSKIAVMAFH